MPMLMFLTRINCGSHMATLLIVDDNTRRRSGIVEHAEAAGIKDIVEVDDYQAALEVIGKKRFDFAIVDMFLTEPPGTTPEGLEIIKRLKTKNPETRVAGITSDHRYQELAARAEVAAGTGGLNGFIATAQPYVNWTELLESTLQRWNAAKIIEIAQGPRHL